MNILSKLKFINLLHFTTKGESYIKFINNGKLGTVKINNLLLNENYVLSYGFDTQNIITVNYSVGDMIYSDHKNTNLIDIPVNTPFNMSIDIKNTFNNYIKLMYFKLDKHVNNNIVISPQISYQYVDNQTQQSFNDNIITDTKIPIITDCNNNLVSVLIPFYNAEHTIDACVTSLLNQTYKHIEIILIDDNSNDATYQKLQKYLSLPNIIYVKNNKNIGPFASKNRGYKLSKGNIICFQDADDISHPNRISLQLQPIIENKTLMTSCLILRTHIDYFNLTDMTIDNFHNIESLIKQARKHKQQYCCSYIFGCVTPMFKRNLIYNMKYLFKDYKHSADAEFYERFNLVFNNILLPVNQNIHNICSQNKLSNHMLIEQPLYYCYQMTGNNITNKITNTQRLVVKQQYKDNLKNNFKSFNFINFYFDKIFVLNLKKDIVKRNKIIDQFSKYNIVFEFIDAAYGYDEPYISKYKANKKSNIKNPGAYGYMESWKIVLEKSIFEQYQRILCFDDDIILCNDFNNKFMEYIKKIDVVAPLWKVLNLGVSQYIWTDVNVENATKNGWYSVPVSTDGSFACGVDSGIFVELLSDLNKFSYVFDSGCLRNIYKKYPNQCFVAFPNIAVADLALSEINKRTNIDRYIDTFKWNLFNS